jgi:DNA-binding CsgD family transcriptional regulator
MWWTKPLISCTFTPVMGFSTKKTAVRLRYAEMAGRDHTWRICAGLSFVYGLGNLIAGETILGFLAMPLFYGFAQRGGFFKTRGKVKIIVMVLFFLASLATQRRFGAGFLWQSCAGIVKALFLCSLLLLSFLPEALKHLDRGESPVVRLSPDKFTRRDVNMLNRVLEGEKYAAIAAEYGLAESTLKNRLRLLFGKIGVADRVGLLVSHARHILALEGDEIRQRGPLNF